MRAATCGLVLLLGCSSAPEQPVSDAGNVTDAAATPDSSDASAMLDAGDAGDAADAAPSPARTIFGAAFNPHDETRHDELVKQWGGLAVVRSYGKGVGDYASEFQSEDVSWNAASSYSFKYLPSEVLAGTHDAEFQSFFENIPANHPVYWTYWHEPDDDIYSDKTFTAPDYRAAWAHIRAIADTVKAKRTDLVEYATFICMSYSMGAKIAPSRPLTGTNGMYPGDDVVDVFGVDAYNGTAPKGTVTDVATQFGVVIDFAQAHQKPWAIGELGSCPVTGDPQGRAKYLQNAFDYWVSRKALPVFVAYFDVDWTSNGSCDYRFDDDAPAVAVWKQAMTQGIGP